MIAISCVEQYGKGSSSKIGACADCLMHLHVMGGGSLSTALDSLLIPMDITGSYRSRFGAALLDMPIPGEYVRPKLALKVGEPN